MTDHDTLDRWIDAHFDEEVRFLQELVRVPTDTPPGNNAPHAERTAQLLESMGLAAERHPVPRERVQAQGLESITNLIVRRRYGDGPVIALNAHGDVVPPGEGWTHDPYGGEIEDGKIYGRAAAVSKCDFATFTFAVRALEAIAVEYEPLHAFLDPEESLGRTEPKIHEDKKNNVSKHVLLDFGDVDAAISGADVVVEGNFSFHSTTHAPIEPHCAVARVSPDGVLTLWSATQITHYVHRALAKVLGLPEHQIRVICRRMGGAFGGKEGQSSIFSQSAALAAWHLKRPVKLRANRDDDMTITGKRHDFRIDYDVGFDDEGRILALDVTLASRCGYSTDFSGPVNDRAVLHIDNCYHLPHLRVVSHRCKTHMQSATAFRGFGGPQGMFGIETVIEEIAQALGKDPLAVRRANLYRDPALSGDALSLTTPYGQRIEDWIGDRVIDQLDAQAAYAERRAAVAAFNAGCGRRKRGLALVPLKFGISFTATMLNQAGALVHVYTDGTVSVNHGGTEMGQGLNTKVAQVVADELGVAVERVRATASDTALVPNASATAASSGTDLNGRAAQFAARQVRHNLAAFVAGLDGVGAGAVRFEAGQVITERHTRSWEAVVAAAYANRIQLWSDGFYRTPKIHYDKTTLSGRPFYYFAYGAAVSEVVIDTLTGE